MMCEHEFESLRTTDGSFCMTACRKCMKSTGEIETLAKAESLLAAAKAELAADIEEKLIPYKISLTKELAIMTERAEQAEAQCNQMEADCADFQAIIKRLREALEEIKQECLDDIDCGEESALGAEIRRIIAALEEKP